MCGRFVQASSPNLLAEHFDVDEVLIGEPPPPRYNVAPRADVLTITGREGVRRMEPMRWGLVPSWAPDVSIGDKLTNARSETVAEKSAFKAAFERRRCIIPADGFYEWQAAPGPKKQPMYCHARSGEPLAFAGLWEFWRPHDQPDAPWMRSCVIVTTAANALMAPVHDRMPVMLRETDWEHWLDGRFDDTVALTDLLVPAPEDLLELWPVSTRVNSARNDDERLVLREDPLTLFP